ncbi:MAG: response regulator receiver protein [Bryobacterales bacterium]|nr:response regulator receiver protein [Bryobacterales bacterium]
MSRILLADHSPHAQRMGERILRDEGYEVVAVTDGETALLRLKELAPDLILADISLPGRSGYEVCEYVKTSGKYPQTRVVLTAGPVTAFDEQRAQAAGSDGFVRKPFEASLLLNTVQPLIEKPDKPAVPRREPGVKPELKTVALAPPTPVVQPPRPIDREQVRAAVILALEASMITMIENITDKVVLGLEADSRSALPVQAKTSAAVAQGATPQQRAAQAAAATPGPPAARPAETKPAPAPEEPVVRIRTPIFRTLS